jgi:hypothetical protein
MKHEFRATSRVMVPLLLFMLVSAVGVNISERIMESSSSEVPRLLGGLLVFLFVLAILVLSVMSIVLMAQRFYKNLLTDEGYLMFTLPVSIHSILWSKIFVSSIWFIVVGIADCAAAFLASLNVNTVNSLAKEIGDMFNGLTSEYAVNGAAFIGETILLVFLACAGLCLLFYAAMSVGFSFPRHKWLLSVVFFFVFQIVLQIIGFGGMFTWVGYSDTAAHMSGFAIMHTSMWVAIGIEAVCCAAFYALTAIMLKKHLNLE